MVTGINADEALAFHASEPRALPMQILDYCAGFLLAFGVQAALLRQAQEGGSWHVEVSLARVAEWLGAWGAGRSIRKWWPAKWMSWSRLGWKTVPSGFW